MKIFIVVLSFLALPLTNQGSARPYLQTLVKEHGLTKMAASPIWRRHFPASKEIPPAMTDFVNEQLGTEKLKELEGETLLQHMEELRDQWFKDFYPEPTEEKVLQVLGEDAELRALMTAFFMAHSSVQERGLRITVQQIFLQSFGLAMFIRAIDREDMDGQELRSKFSDFIENNTMEFVYAGDGDTPHVPGRARVFYGGREDYLLRSNHVKHPPLPGDTLSALWQRGYTDSNLTATMPPQVADILLAQNVLPDKDGFFSEYYPNFYFDLLSEPGIIGNFVPSVYEAEAFDLETIVASELGVEADSDVFKEFIALLNDKKNSASGVQVAQLNRMGYNLEDIGKLTYLTREAIIVSGHYSREAFSNQHGTDISELNKILEKTGELVFFLLQQGYVKNIDDIKPHHTPSPAVMQQAHTENESWSMMSSGKFAIIPKGQPQQE